MVCMVSLVGFMTDTWARLREEDVHRLWDYVQGTRLLNELLLVWPGSRPTFLRSSLDTLLCADATPISKLSAIFSNANPPCKYPALARQGVHEPIFGRGHWEQAGGFGKIFEHCCWTSSFTGESCGTPLWSMARRSSLCCKLRQGARCCVHSCRTQLGTRLSGCKVLVSFTLVVLSLPLLDSILLYPSSNFSALWPRCLDADKWLSCNMFFSYRIHSRQ